MYGEWLHKKHAIFYDALPHYFCEFDIWDRHNNCFLSTQKRHQLLLMVLFYLFPYCIRESHCKDWVTY